MSLKVRVIPKRNPKNLEAPLKYYGVVRRQELITERRLAEQIALMCTVKAPDIRGVLIALQEEIIDNLLAGYSVQLGELGIMRNVLATSGADTLELFNTSFFKKLRTQFIQRQDIRLSLTDPEVKFEEVVYLPTQPNI